MTGQRPQIVKTDNGYQISFDGGYIELRYMDKYTSANDKPFVMLGIKPDDNLKVYDYTRIGIENRKLIDNGQYAAIAIQEE